MDIELTQAAQSGHDPAPVIVGQRHVCKRPAGEVVLVIGKIRLLNSTKGGKGIVEAL
jgi:hypothetical protein